MKKYYVTWTQKVKQQVFDVVYAESEEQALEKFDKGETQGEMEITGEEFMDLFDVEVEEA